MRVIRARILGFCTGVRRTVETARRESGPQRDGQVYTLGPLIHNPVVLGSLEDRGVRVLKEGEIPPASEKSTIIIRNHGVPPRAEAELAGFGVRVIDGTCPHVKASQKKARSFAERGYRVFLAGEENHGEIAGIRGYVEAASPSRDGFPSCYVVSSPEEAERAGDELSRREPSAKTVLISQTTISPGEYKAIGERIRRFFPALEIVNTICGATTERQDALRELCGQVDAVIIAGGKESSNTRRLLSLAGDLGKPAWLVETPEDLPPEVKAYETVGLSAGASTPDSLIDEIEKTLKAL